MIKYFKIYILIAGLLLPLGRSVAALQEADEVRLLLDQAVTLKAEDGSASEYGKIVLKAENLLQKQRVPYRKIIMPWKRILREMERTRNSLVVGLIRNSEREDKYHWLSPLISVDYMLIARNEEMFHSMKKAQITSGQYRAMCDAATAQCDMLRHYGFPEDSILVIPEVRGNMFEQMIFKERADFFIGLLEETEDNLASLGLMKDRLIAVTPIKTVKVYIAANKGFLDLRWLNKLSANCPNNSSECQK